MLIKLLKYFSGYLLVEIKGYSPERFINLCSNRDILLWNLQKYNDGYRFNISIKSYKKLRPIVKKTKTKLSIIEKCGLPIILYKYRKRKVFIMGMVVFLSLIYILSLFIWDISIEGNYSYSNDMIIKYLKINNVFTGIYKSEINCQDIEYKIRNQYSDIGWVSAEIKGTRLIINIKEVLLSGEKQDINIPSHIVAEKEGIITSIITRAGTPLVTAGSVVKKGDILVSGIVDVLGDFELLVNKKTLVADSDIYAKTFYNYEEEYSYDYTVKEYTQKEKKTIGITILSKRIMLYNPKITYEKYDTVEDNTNLKIGNSFYLPVIFNNTSVKEYKEIQKQHTKKELESIANEKLDKFIENLIKKDVQIISNDVTIEVDDKICRVTGKIHVIEKIGIMKTIEDNEWRQDTDNEHSGDNN